MTETKNSPLDQIKNVLLAIKSPQVVRPVLEVFARKGIRGLVTGNTHNALDFLDKTDFAMVIIEDMIPRNTGNPSNNDGAFELLAKIKKDTPELPVVMISADNYGQTYDIRKIVETVVKAIQAGCHDFLSQPVSRNDIEKLLDTILPCKTVQAVISAEEGANCVYKIIGTSATLVQTVRLAQKVATTSAPVMICGESGTGKELISYVVHYSSKRVKGPFVKVNCAAFSETLLESELFGHEKGAFTGAYSQRKGHFEEAHGGTLLLDEISETPLCFQAKLLRILEQQDFQRVGGNQNIKVDVRIISTTNKDISQEVANGRFRQDLYYRLCGIRLTVAPLRERKEDLHDLIWHFVNIYAGQTHRRITRLDTTMMELFAKYHWPGNIRQLRNVILTSMILGTGETLSLADVSWLFNELQPPPEIADSGNQVSYSAIQPDGALAGMQLAQVERQAILETLKQAKGNQTRAAKVLGISDRTLRDKIRRYRQQVSLQPV